VAGCFPVSEQDDLRAILPEAVSVAGTRADVPDAVLLPEERAVVARAVESRRREFAAGRACARVALARWGLSRRAIPVGSEGAPRWPDGIVGSITHCSGYCGCAVARSDDLLALGIDAEPNLPLPGGLLWDVARPEERAWVRDLRRRERDVHWDRLLFSMKESVYKAWFPLVGTRLDFGDAVVSVEPSAGTFSARIAGEIAELSGRWLVRDEILLTAVAVPR
jgi:4'-phosphopantetheinyl transferase EntD